MNKAQMKDIFYLGLQVFGDFTAFGRWMSKENVLLGATPISVCDTDEGKQKVMELLNLLDSQD